MTLIDKNAHLLPEGDYISVCNLLRDAYKVKSGTRYIFDHDEHVINVNNQDAASSEYFLNHYVDSAIFIEKKIIERQIDTILCIRDEYKPLKRITKNVKEKAIGHYCNIHEIHDIEMTEDGLRKYLDETDHCIGDGRKTFEESVKSIYESYMGLENQFRWKCMRLIDERVKSLDWHIDELEQM
jgi:hypothetical protein